MVTITAPQQCSSDESAVKMCISLFRLEELHVVVSQVITCGILTRRF